MVTGRWPRGTARSISRSLDIYYRDAARTARMDRLNAQFVGRGSLAFDIGAHVGDRSASFLRLGARVVAVEPQPAVFRALTLLIGQRSRATLVRAAVGAEPGNVALFVNSSNPTVSTVSKAFIAAASGAEAWKNEVWDHSVHTAMITLDQLISAHGRPDFIKIDVEGHEHEVLKGLSQPVAALSFEFTTLQRQSATAALRRLMQLGPYRFNASLGEDHELRFATWVNIDHMIAEVERLPEAANSGDIYAILSE